MEFHGFLRSYCTKIVSLSYLVELRIMLLNFKFVFRQLLVRVPEDMAKQMNTVGPIRRF